MIFTRTRARWKKAEPAKPADDLQQWEDDGGLVYPDPTSIEQRAVEQVDLFSESERRGRGHDC